MIEPRGHLIRLIEPIDDAVVVARAALDLPTAWRACINCGVDEAASYASRKCRWPADESTVETRGEARILSDEEATKWAKRELRRLNREKNEARDVDLARRLGGA